MLHYPKISDSNSPSQARRGRCIAFEKVDGTNLHWEWDRDFGWHSFGTRRDAFNLTPAGIAEFAQKHAQLREAADVFQATLADGLSQIFSQNPTYLPHPAFKVFTEFVGPNSFAGLHRAEDPKRLILFDVQIDDGADNAGMIPPRTFVQDFGHLPTPRVVYEGSLTGQFIDNVRTGRYDVAEGVVCKGGTCNADLWMVKIKTLAYKERLKQAIGEKWEDYWE